MVPELRNQHRLARLPNPTFAKVMYMLRQSTIRCAPWFSAMVHMSSPRAPWWRISLELEHQKNKSCATSPSVQGGRGESHGVLNGFKDPVVTEKLMNMYLTAPTVNAPKFIGRGYGFSSKPRKGKKNKASKKLRVIDDM